MGLSGWRGPARGVGYCAWLSPFAEVKFSGIPCDEVSRCTTAQTGASIFSASRLAVEGPLYGICRKVWTGAVLDLRGNDAFDDYFGGDLYMDTLSVHVFLDATYSRKSTGFVHDRQHLLRWETPTHILPLGLQEESSHCNPKVYGLLLVQDTDEDNVFIRSGCFYRVFSTREQILATFGGNGRDHDPQRAGKGGIEV